MLYLLDYGAGNVRSLANSITKLGFEFKWVQSPEDLQKADKLLFPGVGAFGPAMQSIRDKGYAEPLKQYIASGKPYMGICIGLQTLFEGSDEAPGVPGLGVVPGIVSSFSPFENDGKDKKSVPQMGWNTAKVVKTRNDGGDEDAIKYGFPDPKSGEQSHYYFVHSYRAQYQPDKHADWVLTTTQYGSEVFLSSIQRGNVFATQFHPEKSGRAGLELLRAWLSHPGTIDASKERLLLDPQQVAVPQPRDGLTKRIVACLDVRSNDDGDLVVTKGESYDVREKADAPASTEVVAEASGSSSPKRKVRNLGKPVDLATRYYLEGADEVTFLNITSFRSCALQDQPMLSLLEAAAAKIFVPLTIGGGIKDSVDPDGTPRPAKEVADAYFRAGADKVSIGSEAVYAVEELYARAAQNGQQGELDPLKFSDACLTGKTGIETISKGYGAQAVVVSIDPRRVYVGQGETVAAAHAACVVEGIKGSEDEGKKWWYRCTVKGGREDRDVDVVQLARGVQRLGAGEVLLNSIDRDGSNKGFDRQLVDLVRNAVDIPVIASSGAGNADHFVDVFANADASKPQGDGTVEAALAAGIFHRNECSINDVKTTLASNGFNVRIEAVAQGAGAITTQ
ncbi:imidazoleglycerol phosphate synthase [Moesziomyces antarcticus]|uniref:Imidazoleglycerol phosphate synthase n=2 Tax=Pseudozyma antarctica TaxID=84753 RepID=A0A081CHM1_PSEA2|nr:imidazoleglycerol phosphate synthase [Moesziomyces antarcticus]GAK66167.1 imidazoleglycerol phosphate synthase [Moesziomyces antarcticus]SPO46945.1 probable HIS7 - glutamine amidotransferase/cyclase [Moesziomyces antarcticus]